MEHQTQLAVSIGDEWTTVIATDYNALAVKYPELATLLDELGVTAKQISAFRLAILSAGIARRVGIHKPERFALSKLGAHIPFSAIAENSALRKNIKLFDDNPDLLLALDRVKFWIEQ